MYRLTDVTKDYPKGRGVVHALQGVNVVIGDGDWLAIQGPTGHGKSTLLQILGAMFEDTGLDTHLEALAGYKPDHYPGYIVFYRARWSMGQLRLRIADGARLNPDTIMPPYYRTTGLQRVAKAFEGKTILTAEQVEDVVAYLATLKE